MADELGTDAAPSRLRPWLKAAGILVTLVALVFVTIAVQRSFDQLQADLSKPGFLAAIAIGSFAYALLLVLLAIAWRGLLVAIDGPVVPFGAALGIYARTQVYKYLPSNVLHMVGRYVEARRAGASHQALGIAQLVEIALLTAAGGLVAVVLALPLLRSQLRHYDLEQWLLPIIVIGCTAIATCLFALVARRLEVRRLAGAILVRGAAAFGLYLLFMLGSSGLAWALAITLGGPASLEIIGITAAAWLVGFLVPGAPGGLGVRDAVLIAGLTAAGVPGATAIALGHRLITTLGDALFAFAGFIARRRP
ncbi:hypothetical protein VW23_004800 [Devosia insulae DS-56]|uniref:Lysylphosphatidylglycerol synthetase n=1 Tax=Devosia insulae DS-56 TaxID=1116389 RepID=A0A1E5XIN7_9HYPH|nr:lysylphosphatidylglycerol synthase domain-containing protein [Devosia insulae]OEO28441.1 hypothetical protein VW23_004800 [Devosia insulae DS-56]